MKPNSSSTLADILLFSLAETEREKKEVVMFHLGDTA